MTLLDRSCLYSSGSSAPHPEVSQWAGLVVSAIRSRLAGAIEATLWPYRIGKSEYLACDIADGSGNCYPITFNVGVPLKCCFDPCGCDPEVPDMAEAIYMAGVVLHELNIKPTVGRL